MSQIIVYLQDSGVAAVIHPSPEALELMSIEDIAAKDVPTGKAYKIISTSDLPSDRIERNGWTVDESDLTDGVGA